MEVKVPLQLVVHLPGNGVTEGLAELVPVRRHGFLGRQIYQGALQSRPGLQ